MQSFGNFPEPTQDRIEFRYRLLVDCEFFQTYFKDKKIYNNAYYMKQNIRNVQSTYWLGIIFKG